MERFAELEVAPRFWDLIASAGRSQAKLRELLSGVSREEVTRFAVEFDYMVDDLVSQATEQEGDTYHEQDIAGWVVSQGVQRFAQVFDREEDFPAEVPDWSSSLRGVATVLFEERFAEPMPWHGVDRWPTVLGRSLIGGLNAEPGTAADGGA